MSAFAEHDIAPVPTAKRRFVERMIRVVDLIIYAVIIVGGVGAIGATPNSVVNELGSNSILVWVWGIMLLIGGVFGFIGRLSRRWMVETPATILAMVGALIYAVVLAGTVRTSTTAVVAIAFTLAAAANLFRRWSELQIFAASGSDNVKTLLAEAVRRKTANFTRHS